MDRIIIDLPTQNRMAEILPGSVSENERTVEVIWSTGAGVKRMGWDGPYIEELSLEESAVDLSRLNNGAAFLDSHNSYELGAILGVTERAWVEGGVGKALVRFDTSPEAEDVFRKIKEKIIRSVSVGYMVNRFENVTPEASDIPVYRAVDWQPFEISAVCVGADAGAGFRAKARINTCVVTQTIKTRNLTTEDSMTETENKAVEATEVVETAKEEKAAETSAAAEQVDATDAVIQEERKRTFEILDTASKLGVPESFARELIKAGTKIDKAKDAIIDWAAENSPAKQLRSVVTDAPSTVIDSSLPLQERCKAEWDKTPSLRGEFGDNYDAYLSFKRNEEKGLIRIMKK